MDQTNNDQVQDLENQETIDSWEKAFAVLEQSSKANDKGASPAGGNAGDNASTAEDGSAQLPDQADGENGAQVEGAVGGSGDDLGESDREDGGAGGNLFSSAESQDAEQYRAELGERLRNQAINEVAAEFIKRGIRNNNGVLGATMDDADVCKRDKDGVPHFYNPETGQEFRGDNPRRQAQEWVDDYNKELARVFNKACQDYENHLMDEAKPGLAVIEFAPKYEKLDDIRRGMFDNVIEDYEVKDANGNVVGYSCDLDKALALVDRQIAMIQSYAKSRQQTQQPQRQPTGPALDMKTTGGTVDPGEQVAPKSLAEAMEIIQNKQLEKMRRG